MQLSLQLNFQKDPIPARQNAERQNTQDILWWYIICFTHLLCNWRIKCDSLSTIDEMRAEEERKFLEGSTSQEDNLDENSIEDSLTSEQKAAITKLEQEVSTMSNELTALRLP